MNSSAFLSRIQEAEEQADGLVKKAEKAAEADILKHQTQCEKNREEAKATKREDARGNLKSAQQMARTQYDKEVEAATKEAESLTKSAGSNIEKQIPLAQTYFISELLTA